MCTDSNSVGGGFDPKTRKAFVLFGDKKIPLEKNYVSFLSRDGTLEKLFDYEAAGLKCDETDCRRSFDAPQKIVDAVVAGIQAVRKFDKIRGAGSHREYTMKLTNSAQEWQFYFDPVTEIHAPGAEAAVFVKRSSDGILYLQD